MKKYLILVLALLVCVSCTDSSSNKASNATKISPSPTTPQTEEEKKAKSEQEDKDQLAAIEAFVTKSHKGWTLAGVSSGLDTAKCEPDAPCYLHLTQKDLSKVVTVLLRRFGKDGKTYWLVYPATNVDLDEARIKSIKEAEREATLSNLTPDDCQSVIDEMAAEKNDADRGDYDGGY